ncbi:ABC transporter substrate-binding protein [Bacteroidia bacterium]|nr:ABC transporter substrate-binding protein [Bacteroidia bacterium]
MISAQNRLLPLSGNKFLGYFLVPLLLISCGAFKKTQKTEWPKDDAVVVVNSQNSEDETAVEVFQKNDTKEEAMIYSSVMFKGQSYRVPKHKDDFNIAVLLPFHSDKSNSRRDKRRADIMLEYYQGIQLALKKGKDLDSRFTVHFYDTDNDTNQLKLILKKPEMETMDLILGPTDEIQVKMAAYFARSRKTPMFSPFTAVTDLWSNNPFIINLNPSNEMKALAFLAYFKKNHHDEKLLIVRDGRRFDKGFGAALVAECVKQEIDFSKIAYNKSTAWKNHLGAEKTVVLLTSEEKLDVTYVATGLLTSVPNVTLIGSDKWMEFSSVDFGQWQKLNVRFLSTNKAHVPNDNAHFVVNNYRLSYKDDPSWYTYMGYDQMLFALEVLDAFGGYFPLFLEGKSIPYANSTMVITKTSTCFQNKFIQLYKLEDCELKAIE